MKAAVYNFNINQGSTMKKVISLKTEDGSAFDLTSYSAIMSAREEVDTSSTVLTSDSGNVTLTINISLGTITLEMTAANTALLDFTTAAWDMELTLASNVQKWFKGVITLNKEVTR